MAGRLQLYIDDREHTLLAKLGMSKAGAAGAASAAQIVDEVMEDGFCIKRKRLIAGDFAIVDTADGHYVAIIERKTYSDMADSIKGDRKANYGKMTAIRDEEAIKNHTSPKLILLLEGSLRTSNTEKENGIPISSMESHMMHLMLRDGFCIWHTASTDDTFRWLMNALRSTGTLLASVKTGAANNICAANNVRAASSLSALPALPVPPITASQPRAAALAARINVGFRKTEFVEKYRNDAEFRAKYASLLESASEQLPAKSGARKPKASSKPTKAEAERVFALAGQANKATQVADWLNKLPSGDNATPVANTTSSAPTVELLDDSDTKSEIITSKMPPPATREVVRSMLTKIPQIGSETAAKFTYKLPIGELLTMTANESTTKCAKPDSDIRKKYITGKQANAVLDKWILLAIDGITVEKVNIMFRECAVSSIEELSRVSLEKLQNISFGKKRAQTVMRRLYDCLHYTE